MTINRATSANPVLNFVENWVTTKINIFIFVGLAAIDVADLKIAIFCFSFKRRERLKHEKSDVLPKAVCDGDILLFCFFVCTGLVRFEFTELYV